MLAEAWMQGAAGLAADIAGLRCSHGVRPARCRGEGLAVYGDADPLAGAPHGIWWRDSLPDAKLELIPDMGHLLAVPLWGRALAFLTAD